MNRIKEVLEQIENKQESLAEKLEKSYNILNEHEQNRQQFRLEVLYKVTKSSDLDVKEPLIEHELLNKR